MDIVLDCLCGENTGKGLGLLKPLGTYILYGWSFSFLCSGTSFLNVILSMMVLVNGIEELRLGLKDDKKNISRHVSGSIRHV